MFDANSRSDTFAGLNLAGTGLSSGGALIDSTTYSNSTLTCPVTLTADSSIGGPGNITLASAITGAHALTYVGTGILTLGGVNTYSSVTTVNSGTLLVNGSTASGSAVTVASGATVGGSGTINGPLTVQPGGILAPGAGAASAGTTLTLPGGVTLGSTCIVSNRISKTTGPTLKADKVNLSSGTLTLAGTLKVVLDSGGLPLASGDTFTLFSATLAGSFASTNLPTLPTGLRWDSSQLAAGGNGTLTVACNGGCTPPSVTGIALDQNGNISLTITGAVGSAWSLRTNNNVAAPLPWPNMTNGIIPSNPFTVLDLPPGNSPQRFYYLTNTLSP